MVTDMLIMNCVDDITKMQEPWPLHIAAEYGYLFKIEYCFLENNLIKKCNLIWRRFRSREHR